VSPVSTLHGRGPEGGHLLGFLCTLGTLAVLDRSAPWVRPRLHWSEAGVWRPVWTLDGAIDEEGLIDLLHQALREGSTGPEFTDLGPSLSKLDVDRFRAFAAKAAETSTPARRRWADFAAAYGVAVGDRFHETPLHMHNLGQLRFFKDVLELVQGTGRDHLRKALFEPWRYDDPQPTMRWDPVDDRRYAYRADNPSDSKIAPIRTVRGANLLAIEALPSLPVVPQSRSSPAIGFRKQGSEWVVRWPIWTTPITLRVIESLLRHPDVAAAPESHQRLRRLGVAEVFQARRVEPRYRSFTLAEALLGSS